MTRDGGVLPISGFPHKAQSGYWGHGHHAFVSLFFKSLTPLRTVRTSVDIACAHMFKQLHTMQRSQATTAATSTEGKFFTVDNSAARRSALHILRAADLDGIAVMAILIIILCSNDATFSGNKVDNCFTQRMTDYSCQTTFVSSKLLLR